MTASNDLQQTLHENIGYWQGRSDAVKGRKVEPCDDAYFHGYRIGLTGGAPPNKYTALADHPELMKPT